MLILHITGHSLVRMTPGRIATYWGRYTEHTGIGICTGRGGGRGMHREPLNPQGFFYTQRHRKEFQELIDKADVIHCHDDSYPTKITNDFSKIMVYHAHIGDIPKRLFRSRRFKYHSHVKHACITNGYGRHFDKEEGRPDVDAKWGRLPDILDLDHPTYCPDGTRTRRNKNDELRVVFTYSNAREPGGKINAKGPIATKRALGIERKPIPGVEIQLRTGLTFEEAMAVKKRAHIVLDEIFSPYTHLSALEGAAVGACVLTSFDEKTVEELCDTLGAPIDSYPFVNVTPQNVREKIEHFRDHPQECYDIGQVSKEWMFKYYHHKDLLDLYLRFYES